MRTRTNDNNNTLTIEATDTPDGTPKRRRTYPVNISGQNIFIDNNVKDNLNYELDEEISEIEFQSANDSVILSHNDDEDFLKVGFEVSIDSQEAFELNKRQLDLIERVHVIPSKDVKTASFLYASGVEMKVYSDEFEGNFNDTALVNKIAIESYMKDNAGGKSKVSEMHSIDILMKKLNAMSCIFEREVQYWCSYKMVDYILSVPLKDEPELPEIRVGVSVTRAYSNRIRSISDAFNLIKKKLEGLVIARNCVVKEQNFFKSILHIWSQSKKVTKLLKQAIQINAKKFLELNTAGTLDIWITTASNYPPIFDDELDQGLLDLYRTLCPPLELEEDKKITIAKTEKKTKTNNPKNQKA